MYHYYQQRFLKGVLTSTLRFFSVRSIGLLLTSELLMKNSILASSFSIYKPSTTTECYWHLGDGLQPSYFTLDHSPDI